MIRTFTVVFHSGHTEAGHEGLRKRERTLVEFPRINRIVGIENDLLDPRGSEDDLV